MSSQDQGGQGLAGAGDYDGGTGGSNRRPHTANLTRSQDGSTAPGEVRKDHRFVTVIAL